MAQYKRSREDNFSVSGNDNEYENPPKRSCPLRDAGVLLLSDLLFADDDIYAQDLQTAQNALVLDMMTIIDQQTNSCNSSNMSSFVSDAAERYSYNHHFWDNCSPPSIFGDTSLANSSCKMDDETCTVSIDYLLRATDEELGIPPTLLSDLNKSDDEAIFNSHDIESVWDDLTLQIELLGGFKKEDGIAGRVVAAHAI